MSTLSFVIRSVPTKRHTKCYWNWLAGERRAAQHQAANDKLTASSNRRPMTTDQHGASGAPYRWYLVGLLFFCAGLNYADRAALASVFPLLSRDLSMSDMALASTGSFFLWSYAAASPFAGYVADRVSRSRLIAISLAAWSISSGLAGFAANANQLLATRVLLGLSECMYLPAAVALIAHHHPIRTRATAMAIHVAGMSVGVIGGGFLGGYLGEHFGWRAMCFILGFGGLVLAVAAHFTLRDGPAREASSAVIPRANLRDLPKLLRTPTFVVIILESMIISVGTWIFYNWLPLFYHDTFGLSLAGRGILGHVHVGKLGGAGHRVGRNPIRPRRGAMARKAHAAYGDRLLAGRAVPVGVCLQPELLADQRRAVPVRAAAVGGIVQRTSNRV